MTFSLEALQASTDERSRSRYNLEPGKNNALSGNEDPVVLMDQHAQSRRILPTERLFAGGGETGTLLQTLEWNMSPLGPVEQWKESLWTALRICLTSRHPLLIWWGPELVMLYNDGYAPMLGKRHPWALGQPGRNVWPEIWDIIGPMLEGVLASGQATWSDDQLLLLERNGYAEECYFTFSYSPIENEQGQVEGVFTAVTETTARVLAERRAEVARNLSAAVVDARTAEEVYPQAATVLEEDVLDIPFALLYQLDSSAGVAHLAASAGLPGGTRLNPTQIALADEIACWPLGQVMQTNQAEIVTGLTACWGEQTARAGGELMPHTALVLPVTEPGQAHPSAILVAGVSPCRLLDDDYRAFYDLLVSHLARALASAHAYEAERRRAEAFAELDRAKTAFFSNVSHEFRTPLTLMLGPLEELLCAKQQTPDTREQLELIHRNGLRLLKLVNTLLDFSRIEAGRAQATYVPTDLAAQTRDLASVFRSLIEKAGMRLIVDCPSLAEVVYIDREMWEKIVLNLLSNAFKFTFGGEIVVSLRQQGQHVHLVIRDTGVGIPPEEVPRLFERFHRVQGARSRTHEGSGIGLALVQELVRLHGGTIHVQSQIGVGTAFTITLPLGTAHLPVEHLQASDLHTSTALGAAPFIEEASCWLPLEAAGDEPVLEGLARGDLSSPEHRLKDAQQHPARILLADDNADLRAYVRRLLGERYEVEVVDHGAAALHAARVRPPDLVLSDVMMPELDGFGLLRALRADPRLRAIPVILLSARAGEEATVEGLETGADDYLIKPFSARELLARVEGRLEIARLRQEANARARELEAVFEAMTDGIDMVDAHGVIRQMNQAGYQLLGLESQEAAQTYCAQTPQARSQMLLMRDEHGELLPPERAPAARVVRGETLAGPTALDVQVRTLDGRERAWEFSGAPTRDGVGNINGGVVMFRDVTERRALERRTAKSLAALLEMAQTLVQGIGSDLPSTEVDAHILPRIARLVQRVLGSQYTGATLVTPETGALHPLIVVGVSPEVEARWWQNLSGGKLTDFMPVDLAERLYAGEVLTLDLAHQPPVPSQCCFDIQQVLAAAVWVNQEQVCLLAVEIQNRSTFTSEEKELVQAAVRLMALMLERDRLLRERAAADARALASEETARQMDEFLGIASHELRTPLTSITMSVQTAERQLRQALATNLPQEVGDRLARTHHLAERLAHQVKRMDRLVGDLLDITRITAGKLELRPAPCELGSVVREAVEMQQAAWPKRKISLALPAESGVPLLADADRLGQVVTNYLTNALKYSGEEQPIAVRLVVQDGHARVEVRDRGPGLAPDQQAQVFERFYRVSGIAQRSGSGVGLGLGLYICQTIISRHGGLVGVESVVGQGSIFYFTLPLSPEQGRAHLPSEPLP